MRPGFGRNERRTELRQSFQVTAPTIPPISTSARFASFTKPDRMHMKLYSQCSNVTRFIREKQNIKLTKLTENEQGRTFERRPSFFSSLVHCWSSASHSRATADMHHQSSSPSLPHFLLGSNSLCSYHKKIPVSHWEKHGNGTIKTSKIRSKMLPSYGLLVVPPMPSIEDQHIVISPLGWGPIHLI